MGSCLNWLWKEIDPLISEVLHDSDDSTLYESHNRTLRSIADKILKFVDLAMRERKRKNDVIDLTHLITFAEYLKNENGSPSEKLKKAARFALESVQTCKLCSVCQNCSFERYESISKAEMNERAVSHGLNSYFSKPQRMFYYLSYYDKMKMINTLEDSIFCLKGFSSSTPLIHSATFENACYGGGIYINFGGKGIVIDPGVDFVTTMHKNGICIRDVDAVIITHAHMDHNADAELLSSLNHDYNSYVSRSFFVGKLLERKQMPAHKIKWIVDDLDYKKLKPDEANREPDDAKREPDDTNVFELLSESDGCCIFEDDDSIRLQIIETRHMRKAKTYGIKLTYGDFKIGYTSDTAYLDSFDHFFDGLDVLLFNISDIYENDVIGIKSKSGHLGYHGCISLLRNIPKKPRLSIASEFCCTNGDIREQIVAKLAYDLGEQYEGTLLPGESGLVISVPQLEVKCDMCNIKADHEKIYTLSPKHEYGKIRFVCCECFRSMKK